MLKKHCMLSHIFQVDSSHDFLCYDAISDMARYSITTQKTMAWTFITMNTSNLTFQIELEAWNLLLNIVLPSHHSTVSQWACLHATLKDTLYQAKQYKVDFMVLHWTLHAQNIKCVTYFSSFKSSFKWSWLTDPWGSLRNDWIRLSIPA